MTSALPSWADLKSAWSTGWKALSARAASIYAAMVQADPTGTATRISGFTTALDETRATLDRIRARLPQRPHTDTDPQAVARNHDRERRWHDLAAGLFADATPAQSAPVLGMGPALVVSGLAITAVGLAWAAAAYEYAVNLKEQTALAERELDARVDASRDGRALLPSTLPPLPPSPAESGRTLGLWLLGGLAIAAGALTIPLFLDRR